MGNIKIVLGALAHADRGITLVFCTDACAAYAKQYIIGFALLPQPNSSLSGYNKTDNIMVGNKMKQTVLWSGSNETDSIMVGLVQHQYNGECVTLVVYQVNIYQNVHFLKY